jgi:hypothetical protein
MLQALFIFWGNVLVGKCLSGHMCVWANVFLVNVLLDNYHTSNSNLSNCISGQLLSGQMSFWANVFLGKCLSGQISFWANVIWANVMEPIQLQLSLVNFCFALCGFLTMRKYKDIRIILINGQFGTCHSSTIY